jgi:hypothetical protein
VLTTFKRTPIICIRLDDIGSDGLKRIASLRRSVRCVEKTSTKEDDIVETITEPKKEEKEV